MGPLNQKLLTFVATFLMCANPTWAQQYYTVKTGDVLSRIARKNFGKPVYSQNGSLNKILKLNPDIKTPDRIFVGQKILISEITETPATPISAPAVEEPKQAICQESPPAKTEEINKTQIATPISRPEEDPESHLGFSTGFEFFRVDATDKSTNASTTLLSSMSPQLQFNWILQFSKKWASILKFSYQTERILDDIASNPRTIISGSGSRYGFEMGVIDSNTENSKVKYSLAFKERIFEHSNSATTLSIDRVTIPSLSVNYRHDILHFRTASLGVGLTGEYLFSGKGPGYNIDSGWGAEVEAYLKHELKSVTLQGGLYYGINQQNSSLVDQNGSHMGATFGLVWKLGE